MKLCVHAISVNCSVKMTKRYFLFQTERGGDWLAQERGGDGWYGGQEEAIWCRTVDLYFWSFTIEKRNITTQHTINKPVFVRVWVTVKTWCLQWKKDSGWIFVKASIFFAHKGVELCYGFMMWRLVNLGKLSVINKSVKCSGRTGLCHQ